MKPSAMQGAWTVVVLACTAVANAQTVKGTSVNAPPSVAPTRFIVRVENISTRTSLKLPKGGGVDMPLSHGVWAVHAGGNPILSPGTLDAGVGLKGLAEAGMAAALAANLSRVPGVRSHGVLDKPMMPAAVMAGKGHGKGAPASPPIGAGARMAAPKLMPSAEQSMLMAGSLVETTIEGRPGDRLSLAFMLGHSNDGIIGTGATGIALFDAQGRPISGDVTSAIGLWDAGTEVNEQPGIGRNQGMRQGAPTAGDPERRPVRPMADAEFGQAWPAAGRLLRVTIVPGLR